ncbi:uncharacterized protein BXZ73DRAFT_29930, partial [Epithele typhae]|uniref:uncharacterized protein n=1 Tax=Epithele typhae TaxID=378194 RepID=UPI0020080DD1
LVWEVALACLAISIKFHRDVLFPLEIIFAEEFLQLAHRGTDFDAFEHAQRSVLDALHHCVGSATPAAFMEELWSALPTLRRLMGFDDGWRKVQHEAWIVIAGALFDPEMLRFPLSLVTAAAVMEGVVKTLCERFK